MQNIITMSGPGAIALSFVNSGENSLVAAGEPHNEFLTSSSSSFTLSNYVVVNITNDFVGIDGNYYLFLDSTEEISNYTHYNYHVEKYEMHVHDLHKGIEDLEAALDNSQFAYNLRENFQDGVDAIYNAIVANGVTPSASTPTACADGINQVATSKRNEGRADKQTNTYSLKAYCTHCESAFDGYMVKYLYRLYNGATLVAATTVEDTELEMTVKTVGTEYPMESLTFAHSYKGIGSQA